MMVAWCFYKLPDNQGCSRRCLTAVIDDKAGSLRRVFHLRFNKKEMVQEIYFLRQLSHDEAARKVGCLL